MNELFKLCPNCGGKNHAFLNGKQFVCNDCKYVYFHNAAAACAIILEYENKILFTIRNQDPGKGTLDLPGGFIDANESIEEGLKRELHEELGITIGQMRYLTSFPNKYPYKGLIYSTCDAFFVAKLDTLPQQLQKEEIQSIELIDPRQLDLNRIVLQSIKNAIEFYIREH